MRTQRNPLGRPRAAGIGALAVSLTGLAVFGSVVAGVGDWMQGRELSVVLPWALPALVVSAVATAASLTAVRTRRAPTPAVLGAVVVALALAAVVLVNPATGHPVP